ncbi:hydroxyisourate hydrolase [Gluconobacter kondonii]|uniref:hydroxyisourate hydrolase n=1 Tax=Gluconobacter kondonii TaxID=941463 RepID=UPI001B8C1657|nr:hydroxyisourate hydrolase [Gluconobacter kondonii]MBS1080487.1 hydroxyisourate hydrolase [Gluconobacter kondonii]
MSSLSTHVLDTVSGKPAAGVSLRLLQGDRVLFEGQTNADGRCPELRDVAVSKGTYCLEFRIGDYFRKGGQVLSDPPFLDVVPIVFGLAAGAHAHVPLLAAPFGYSTYRGS